MEVEVVLMLQENMVVVQDQVLYMVVQQMDHLLLVTMEVVQLVVLLLNQEMLNTHLVHQQVEIG